MLQGSIKKTYPFPLEYKLHCLIIRCYEGWFHDIKGLGVYGKPLIMDLSLKWTWLLQMEGFMGLVKILDKGGGV